MKAYQVSGCCPEEYAVLVFANSDEEARRLGYTVPDLKEEVENGLLEVRIARDHEIANYEESVTTPRVEQDNKILRRYGWSMDGEDRCECCDMAAMDIPEYEVCPDCMQCKSCGCACQDDTPIDLWP
jgi:hypothetical protein